MLLSLQTLGQNFHLPLSVQAREEIADLQTLTASTNLVEGVPGRWKCIWGKGDFTASWFDLHRFRDMQVDDAFQWIGKTKCTMKWKVFAWLLLADRLNTRNILRRRNYTLQDNNYGCLLCDNPPKETAEYLSFKCPFSTACWETQGIMWADLDNGLQLLHASRKIWSKPLFKETFVVATWSLWKERNNKHFRGVTPTHVARLDRLKNDFLLYTQVQD